MAVAGCGGAAQIWPSGFNPAAEVLRMRRGGDQRRVEAGGERLRRRRAAGPNLGFPATDGDAKSTYATRANGRIDLGRRLGRRRGGAGGPRGGRRGGAGANSGDASPGATVHKDDDA
jgi:hypothetical protein